MLSRTLVPDGPRGRWMLDQFALVDSSYIDNLPCGCQMNKDAGIIGERLRGVIEIEIEIEDLKRGFPDFDFD
jgi:hypothetical protein